MNADSQSKLPWRLIVVSDFGSDSSPITTVSPTDCDSRLADMGAGVDLELGEPSASKPLRFEAEIGRAHV